MFKRCPCGSENHRNQKSGRSIRVLALLSRNAVIRSSSADRNSIGVRRAGLTAPSLT